MTIVHMNAQYARRHDQQQLAEVQVETQAQS